MTCSSPDPEAIEAIELPLLLEAMVQRYGYDFRDYAVEQFGVVRSLGSLSQGGRASGLGTSVSRGSRERVPVRALHAVRIGSERRKLS